MSKVAVSFTHIIKSGEPAFSVSSLTVPPRRAFPLPVYLSLVPIIGGCALAAITELNFNMIGFMGAMISNLAFVVSQHILKERNERQISWRNQLLRVLVDDVFTDSYSLCNSRRGTKNVGSRMGQCSLSSRPSVHNGN
ncbi:unnamed protein product [Rhodiola kirilowii]